MSNLRPVLLVGSVPLQSAEQVFEAAGAQLGPALRTISDGETGPRLGWITWLWHQLAQRPGMEVKASIPIGGDLNQVMTVLAIKEGIKPSELELRPFGYVQEAQASYKKFKAAQASGKLPSHLRFQVTFPSPMVIASNVAGADRHEVVAAFEKALSEEIDELCTLIPPQDLAIQLDMVEPCGEEHRRHPGRARPFADKANFWWTLDEGVDSAARVANTVHPKAQLGFHLCYGDPDGKHVIEPMDATVLTDLINALSQRVTRQIDWIHLPVPIERDDEAYFAPLKNLKTQPGTQLYLGLLHHEDGVEGAKRRIDTAKKFVADFGLATECGLGRLPADVVPGLLDLHRRAAAL